MSVLPSIDAMLGGTGLVPGRIVELCGDPGTGKTALTYDLSFVHARRIEV